MERLNRNRRSSEVNRNSIKVIQQALDKFVSKKFLTSNSLFNNLLSSQELKIDLSSNEFLKTLFGTKTLMQKDLFQFCYFHRYEKKMILYNFLKVFLQVTTKIEIVMMLNGQKIDMAELNKFLGPKLWQQFSKRVIIYTNMNVNTFVFNLQWLWHLMKQRQFLKGLIICDINSFESSDKTSGQKYYKKISKELFTLSFRKDFYEFKIMQKSALSYFSDDHQEIQEINEKVSHYLHKKYDFNYKPCLVVPIEYISENVKSLEETYRSVLLWANPNNEHIQQIIFSSQPFKIESFRQL